jgi:hypothetical protein
MKKILTFIALISFLSTNAQFNKGTIYTKNGKPKNGLIKIRLLGGIKFKESESSKVMFYDYKHMSGYDIKDDGIIKKYRYKQIGNGRPRRMKIVELGKINLYRIFVSNAGSSMAMGLPVSEGYVYFIEKNNKTIRIGGKIKNKRMNLFSDCPILIEKIKNKEFKKREVIEIVDYYNNNCGE